MYIILLSGGSGKRLWPLSNDLRSKQYIKVIEKEDSAQKCSMVQRVWSQLQAADLAKSCIVTASKGQVEILKSQLGMDVNIAVEPERRDTYPAVVLSCAYLKSVLGSNDEDVVAILPVDPYTEKSYFETVKELEDVLLSTDAQIALMGAKPTYPSAKYGYIIPKKDHTTYIEVDSFKEKPTEEQAEELLKNNALWNCGVFCFKIGDIANQTKQFGISDNYRDVYDNYDRLPKISFDYQVLEKCSSIVAVPFEGYWKDLGTWNTLAEEMTSNTIGNVITDKTCENTCVINELCIPLVVMGAKDMIVSASPDGILVADRHQSSYIKDCLKDLNYPPMFEERRWGTIEVLNISEYGDKRTTARKIVLFAGMNSSYHFHKNRREVWTVLAGRGEMVVDGITQNICDGSVIQIPSGIKHAVRAISDLELIEVQIGDSLADEDINRITMQWNEIDLKGK